MVVGGNWDEGKIRVRCQKDSKKYGSGVETKEE